MSSYHAFLDARFLTGSKTLFEKFKTDFLEKLPVKWTKRYNEIKEEILTSRFLNEERPILLSEPNLKTDLCGLRDIQYMFWMEKSVRNLPSIGVVHTSGFSKRRNPTSTRSLRFHLTGKNRDAHTHCSKNGSFRS
ncbi:GlnD PII-uridylyltransferase domain protein [Leptospira borgpetersenii serovar Hardjo-bovis str. Sponselee]|uniref:GlnD PII-uridylyltransferase domain protein n=1 Tax=Leptospira borgpetersenii serovar Hardjo-bovis str. Sponselee TaxID=1303729 RepID=M6BWH0_LEPBO|nr:GlnD PII-uridylyltransferase domain protein [Leptospira borgpetersenii serovar Hardjo-bovis str. Sponselee]